MHTCEEVAKAGKEPPQRSQPNNPQNSHKARNSSHSPQPECKDLRGHGGFEQSSEGYYLNSVAKLALNQKLFWIHLTEFKNKPQKVQTISKELSCFLEESQKYLKEKQQTSCQKLHMPECSGVTSLNTKSKKKKNPKPRLLYPAKLT